MSERRVLVISWDRIGEMMAGSAIRALEMARALVAPDTEVTLAAPEGSSDEGVGGVRLAVYPRESSLGGLIERADVVVLSGRVELMSAVKKPLVVDLYDPFIFSNLELYGRAFNRSSGRPLLALRWLQHHLAHGDFFLCASTVQRSFWLGMLAAAGRLNRANYEQDPELANLLAVVPFGISDEPPVAGAPVLKGVVPGIGTDDHIVLWAGGMWNWVDPITLVRATGLVRARRPDVKTVILGARHPNPEIGEMTVAREARALAAELGLLDDGVWFIDWVAYRERQRYVLESDVGVSLHGPGVESEFAFRTRLLDYLWCLRPMVVTTGDELAARVEREDLGRVVPPEDAPAVASAIEALLDASAAEKEAREARLAAARASLGWSKVIEPLRRFCAAARHAPDHSGEAWFAADPGTEPSIRKEDALIAEEFISSARAISSALGEDYAPRQRFVATYDNLCQIDVLFWVEPAVSGNLVFELGATGSDLPAARVVVPAAQLPHCDWQRFEFRPIPASRGREFELRLKLLPSSARPADDAASPAPNAGAAPAAASAGRVCVWRCAPRQEPVLAGDSVAFIARYLVSGLIDLVPAAPESFLFLHNTTLPRSVPALAGAGGETPADAEMDFAAVEPSPVVDQLRAELARVTAQAAESERRVRRLESSLEARMRASAHAAVRREIHRGHYLVGIFEELMRLAARGFRLAKRMGGLILVVLLAAASVPLALVTALSLACVDVAARLARRRPAADPLPAASGAVGPAPGSGPTREARAVRAGGPVSILIPTWNGRSLLEMSLPPLVRAVRRHGNPASEIIVIDNGSDDDTLAYLAGLAAETPELRTVALPKNAFFAGAINRGVEQARTETLILLNNDMVVEPDFIAPLLEAFDAEPDLFGVSCQIDFIDPEKPRWETGKAHGELRWGTIRLFHLARFDEDLLYPVFFAGGGASAFDRAKFLALGGFDEAIYSPLYIEDVDIAYRAWKRGWPSVLAPRSRVHHKHRGTTRRLWSDERITSFFVKNLVALVWKNFTSWRLLVRHLAGLAVLPPRVFRDAGGRAALATFGGVARQLPLALRARWRESRAGRVLRDEEVLHVSRYRHAYRARFHLAGDGEDTDRPQLLLVAPYSPAPALHGGAVRMLNLLRETHDACEVTLVSFADTEAELRPESLTLLSGLCRDVVILPRSLAGSGGRFAPTKTRGFVSAAMSEEVEYWLDRRRFDVVQAEYTHMAQYLPPPCQGLLRVLVEHDITFVAVARERTLARSFVRKLVLWYDGLRTLRQEIAAVEGADLVLTMSDADRDVLARLVDPRHLVAVPNGVSCRDFPFASDAAEPATVLFVGFFRHEPNVEAVEFFAREVLPLVRERIPAVRFRVVGAYPPPSLAALAAGDPSVELTGMVDDIAAHYRRATVFVAPILRGSGTRLKILEAMASGCPVVSTTVGAEGLGATANEICICDAAPAIAAAVSELLADEGKRRALARAAHRFVAARYDWPGIAGRLLDVYGFRRRPLHRLAEAG